MKPIRVLIVENHTLVRAGLCALLKSSSEIEVVAEASDGREALKLISKHRPDVVLMDIALPGLNGLEVARRVTSRFSEVRVLVLSMYSDKEYVWQALGAGAAGYLLKSSAVRDLELAIKCVARGETYFCPPVSKYMVPDLVGRVRGERSTFERLTPRQREVLQLIAECHSTKEIAQILNLSAKTVETHRAKLMERLSIHEVAGLVRYAIRIGLVKLEE